MQTFEHMNRREASAYIRQRWGLRCAPSTLAKMAITGEGPPFRKAGKWPIYERGDLDKWAQKRMSPPARSTAEHMAREHA